MQNDPGSFDGYTLFSCIYTDNAYLIDNCGKVVHKWEDGVRLANSMYLQEDGSLIRNYNSDNADPTIRIGGGGEGIQKVDWDGTILWDFKYNSAEYRIHHDFAVMPNGNILSLAFEEYDYDECIQAGRSPDRLVDEKLWPEKIIEIEPTGPNSGNIVWEWRIWDHLIQDFDSTKDNYGWVADHPELLDINFITYQVGNSGEADWLHFNSIDYNPELDQILVSCQRLSEIYIIDHSTTTAQAAGHTGGRYGKGGDFLYRYGNPKSYKLGTDEDRRLYFQHDAYWIPEPYLDGGKIMVFNNGDFRSPDHSSVDVIHPPMDSQGNYLREPQEIFGPVNVDWEYKSPNIEDFYSLFVSGSRRLPNGNTLIVEGQEGRFFEVDYDGEIVWEYINPLTGSGILAQGDEVPWNGWTNNNATFRAERYAPDFPGFGGRDLTPGEPLEVNPWDYECESGQRFPLSMIMYPSVTHESITLEFENYYGNDATILVFNSAGQKVYEYLAPKPIHTIDVSTWGDGLYIMRVGDQLFERFVVTK